MNKELRKLAEQAGLVVMHPEWKHLPGAPEDNAYLAHSTFEALEAFARLVAEDCARICMEIDSRGPICDDPETLRRILANDESEACSYAIRARYS
jgi:hypothetical protein